MRAAIVSVAILTILSTSGCRKSEGPSGSTDITVTGTWEGTTDGKSLHLSLTEVKSDSIIGLVTVVNQTLIDSFSITYGVRAASDSIFIELIPWRVRCVPLTYFHLSGRLLNNSEMEGIFGQLCGHPPGITENWHANKAR